MASKDFFYYMQKKIQDTLIFPLFCEIHIGLELDEAVQMMTVV